MKKVSKYIGLALAAVAFLVVCAASFISIRGIPTYEKPAAQPVKVALTSASIKQGEAIAVAMCADCHLDRKTRSFTGKPLNELPAEFGKIYAANITQDPEHGIGAWTDDEIRVLLRTGIGRDGRFRVMMPNFVHMSDEDMQGIITFLRSNHEWVRPNAKPSHEQEPSLLAKALVNTVMTPTPMPTAAVVAPAPTDQIAYGRYLVLGRYKCYDCHSKDFKTNNALKPEKSEGFMAGGSHMMTPEQVELVTPNLTMDPETGLGDWSEAQFVRAVKFGLSPAGPLRTPMPKFSLMEDAEAKAIYAYLNTLPVIKNATPGDGAAAEAVATR